MFPSIVIKHESLMEQGKEDLFDLPSIFKHVTNIMATHGGCAHMTDEGHKMVLCQETQHSK